MLGEFDTSSPKRERNWVENKTTKQLTNSTHHVDHHVFLYLYDVDRQKAIIFA